MIYTIDVELVLSAIEYLEEKEKLNNVESIIYKLFMAASDGKPNIIQHGRKMYKIELKEDQYKYIKKLAQEIYGYVVYELDNYIFPNELTKYLIYQMKKIKKRTQNEELILTALEEALLSDRTIDGVKVNDVKLSKNEEKYIYKLLEKMKIIKGRDENGNYVYNKGMIICR